MKYFLSGCLVIVLGLTAQLAFTHFAHAASPAGSNIWIDGSIYSITSDGLRRPYMSREVFLSYGFNSIDKVSLGDEEDKALPVGPPMIPHDGKLVCSNSSFDWGTCYLITDYKKAAFASAAILAEQGYDFKNSFYADLSLMTSAEPIVDGKSAHRYGSMINLDGTVYFVGKNGLVGVPDLETLTSWGYSLADVVPGNAADKAMLVKLILEHRGQNEPRPFEPIIPDQLQLHNDQKFILPLNSRQTQITEGWLYSADERSIHGYTQHGGIDFAHVRGTPIYAAADGYAISSTQLAPLSRTYQGKTVGFGLGEFVQIWHPVQGVYTSYSHLQRVADTIPYFKPKCTGSSCDPTVVYHSVAEIQKKGHFVKQAELIGWMGDSGLSWGYTETPRNERDFIEQPSWDEVHLHFEMYTRDPVNFYKARRYDPFGLYGRHYQYDEQSYVGPQSLWKKDANGQPVVAQ